MKIKLILVTFILSFIIFSCNNSPHNSNEIYCKDHGGAISIATSQSGMVAVVLCKDSTVER